MFPRLKVYGKIKMFQSVESFDICDAVITKSCRSDMLKKRKYHKDIPCKENLFVSTPKSSPSSDTQIDVHYNSLFVLQIMTICRLGLCHQIYRSLGPQQVSARALRLNCLEPFRTEVKAPLYFGYFDGRHFTTTSISLSKVRKQIKNNKR